MELLYEYIPVAISPEVLVVLSPEISANISAVIPPGIYPRIPPGIFVVTPQEVSPSIPSEILFWNFTTDLSKGSSRISFGILPGVLEFLDEF